MPVNMRTVWIKYWCANALSMSGRWHSHAKQCGPLRISHVRIIGQGVMPFMSGASSFIILQGGSSLSPQILRSPLSTPFLRPWNFALVFNVPLPNRQRFFFSASYFWVFVFFGYLGLKGSHISSEKINNRKGLGRGTLNTCKTSGSYLSKTAWTFWLLGGKRSKITASPGNYLVIVYIRFLGVKYLILVLRSQLFEYLRENLYVQPCLGAPRSDSFRK